MSPMEDFVSVIFTTYNQPQWLQKVLWGFECQTHKNFEIVIADDGSQEATRELVQNFRENSHLRIQHIWHPDEGYQKCPILNKAIVASKADYLIFTDGDCIPVPILLPNIFKGVSRATSFPVALYDFLLI